MPSKESLTANLTSKIIPGLTQRKIQTYANNNGVYERGLDYYKRGVISEVAKIEKTIRATVFGSNEQEYTVKIILDDNGINELKCTCPYDGEFCKHIIAVLLYCLYDEAKVLQTQPLDKVLYELDQAQLRSLVETIARGDHRLYSKICMEVDLIRATNKSFDDNKFSKKCNGFIDPTPYKNEIIDAFKKTRYDAEGWDYYSEEGWDGSEIVEKLTQIVAKVETICTSGNGVAALKLLEVVTEVCVDECSSLDEECGYYDDGDGYVEDIFSILSLAWCKVILTTDLSREEIRYYASLVTTWQTDCEIGCSDSFYAISIALKEGWHDSSVQRALTGALTPVDLKFERDKKIVVQARLKVLLWQQRFDEYIHFARYAQFIPELVEVLLKRGSKDEAFVSAEKATLNYAELLLIAKKFAEYNEPIYAIKIAQKGLLEETHNIELSDWLTTFAELHKCTDIAKQAAIVSCKIQPTLERYLRSLHLTPSNQINEAKKELIDYLIKHKNNFSNDDMVNIFLHENLIDQAMEIFNKQNLYFINESAVKKVMRAAISYKPAWVINYADKLAMAIIEPGKAQYYSNAISWLSFVRDTYKANGQDSEWVIYLNNIKVQHKTKRKLMALCNDAF